MTKTRLIMMVVLVLGVATIGVIALAADLSSDGAQRSFVRQLTTAVQDNSPVREAVEATATPDSGADGQTPSRLGDEETMLPAGEQMESTRSDAHDTGFRFQGQRQRQR